MEKSYADGKEKIYYLWKITIKEKQKKINKKKKGRKELQATSGSNKTG